MSTLTSAQCLTKRPVAQRNDSALDLNEIAVKRRPRVIERRVNAQQQSRLFRLPFELRLMIYEFALPTKVLPTILTASSDPPCAITTQDPPSAAEPSFLRTCRLAREEALSSFYRHNDFYLNRRPSLDFQHPLIMSMNPALIQSKKNKSSGTKWLYAMSTDKIAQVKTVVLAQIGRGMYKDSANDWRRDASACFRVRFLSHGDRRRLGKDWEVQYLKIDQSGVSDRYAERLVKALEMRMEQIAGEKGVREWTREDIWDLAYLL